MSDYYLHDLDPVIFRITDKIALNWYGLSYLLAFVCAWFILNWLGKRNLSPFKGDQLGDFITGVAIFGVLLGGRLGYVLFYMIPANGWDYIASNPWSVLEVWNGGMSFHGGLLGVAIYTWLYCWRKKIPFLAVTDALAVAAALGLFFGRIANFINGELYGRVTTSSLAMKFPLELKEKPELALKALHNIQEQCPEQFYAYYQSADGNTFNYVDWMITSARTDPAIAEAVAGVLPPRHPSQIYEAMCEGLFIFGVLLFLRIRFPRMANGWLTGFMLILYAAARITIENYREPDSPFVGNLTRGQYLSLFMIVAGTVFLVRAWKSGPKPEVGPETPEGDGIDGSSTRDNREQPAGGQSSGDASENSESKPSPRN